MGRKHGLAERETERIASGSMPGLLARMRSRGVFRVAFSYAVIAWLCLQIGDVVLDPLEAPAWVMRALIVLVFAGFPVALILAWYFELGPDGVVADRLPETAARPSTQGVRRYADLIIIAVLLGVIVLLLARQGGLLEDKAATPVIGVLPFTEQGAPIDGYFGAGLADTLTYKLGQLRQILVLAPSSTREFSGPGQDLKAVGALLGATALLEGTVRRAAGSLKVNARLVEVDSGRQLWSGSFDRAGSDLFAVQDEIATAVTEALQLVISPETMERITHPLTSSLSAYDAYLLGQSRMATRDSRKMPESVEFFRQAINTDPGFSLAHAALVEAIYLSSAYSNTANDWANVRTEALTTAARAQAIDPDSGEGYLAQALVAIGDTEFGDDSAWPREYILSLLRKAIELSPNNVSALKFYSNYTDSNEESLALLQRAAQLDPRSGIIQLNLGDSLARAGDKDGALSHYLAAIRVSEGEFALGQMVLPFTLQFSLGRVDDAARWARRLNRTFPNRDSTISLLRALLGLGAWEDVATVINSPPAGMAANDPVLLRQRIVLSLAGNDCAGVDAAVTILEDKLTRMTQGTELANLPAALILEPARTAQALCLVRGGQSKEALRLLAAANRELDFLAFPNLAALALRTQILLAALYKAEGQQEQAMTLLDELLDAARNTPVANIESASFSRFMALAVKGEREASVAELQLVIDQGWTGDWWLLDALAFDPDYAEIMNDPRVQALQEQVEERVRNMRENFLARPDPSEEQLRQAGLLPLP